jgi:anti-sigma28 factor (negative regulator of flagellin synthesis)
MRIDPQNLGLPLPDTAIGARPRAASGGASAAAVPGTDPARLLTDATRVTQLAGEASRYPEIRQERVDGLQRVLQSGSYHPEPAAIASALLADLVGQ